MMEVIIISFWQHIKPQYTWHNTIIMSYCFANLSELTKYGNFVKPCSRTSFTLRSVFSDSNHLVLKLFLVMTYTNLNLKSLNTQFYLCGECFNSFCWCFFIFIVGCFFFAFNFIVRESAFVYPHPFPWAVFWNFMPLFKLDNLVKFSLALTVFEFARSMNWYCSKHTNYNKTSNTIHVALKKVIFCKYYFLYLDSKLTYWILLHFISVFVCALYLEQLS